MVNILGGLFISRCLRKLFVINLTLNVCFRLRECEIKSKIKFIADRNTATPVSCAPAKALNNVLLNAPVF